MKCKNIFFSHKPDEGRRQREGALQEAFATHPALYDPELLYVECRNCGNPVLWEPGKTTQLLQAAGVRLDALDACCLIVSDGCPACRPREREGFSLAVVRVAGLTPEEAMHMAKPGGRA